MKKVMFSINFMHQMQLSKKFFLLLLALEIFVNFSGITISFFSNDSALYASISKTMVCRNDFLNLYVYDVDWLDKPHFPFWMGALSFKIFGVHEWSYRLPALLFILLGAYYTYLLAKKIYNQDVARIAVLVLLSAQHLIMSNTDVRAEPYLLTLIVASVYHFYILFRRFSITHLLLGSLFASCAVMTKGAFALVPIVSAIIGHAGFTNQMRQLFRWRWLFAFFLFVIFILPEVYAVYIQFDQHPEKIVFDKTGISGVKWFLWDSQFSRFINNGPITRPRGDVFYYVHTLLWAYAPWCLVFYYVLAKKMNAVTGKIKLKEYVTISAIIPMLLFFLLSKFQLNFYTNILFPFFSILTASFMVSVFSRKEKIFYTIAQMVYSSVFFLAFILINYLFRPPYQWVYFIGSLTFIILMIFCFNFFSTAVRWLLISCLTVLFFNFYLNLVLYPTMASLKGENQAAEYVNKFYPNKKLGVFQNRKNGFEFYASQPVEQVNMDKWIMGLEKERIFYADDIIYSELISKNASFKILKEFSDFNSENISVPFINNATREKMLQKAYLIQ